MDKTLIRVFGVRFPNGYKKFNPPRMRQITKDPSIPEEPSPTFFENQRDGFDAETLVTRDVEDTFAMAEEIRQLQYGTKIDIQPERLLDLMKKPFEYNEKIIEKDAFGKIVTDKNGNPVYLDGARKSSSILDLLKSFDNSLSIIERSRDYSNVESNIQNLNQLNIAFRQISQQMPGNNWFSQNIPTLLITVEDQLGKLREIQNALKQKPPLYSQEEASNNRKNAIQTIKNKISEIFVQFPIPSNDEIKEEVFKDNQIPFADKQAEIAKRINAKNSLQSLIRNSGFVAREEKQTEQKIGALPSAIIKKGVVNNNEFTNDATEKQKDFWRILITSKQRTKFNADESKEITDTGDNLETMINANNILKQSISVGTNNKKYWNGDLIEQRIGKLNTQAIYKRIFKLGKFQLNDNTYAFNSQAGALTFPQKITDFYTGIKNNVNVVIWDEENQNISYVTKNEAVRFSGGLG